MLLQQQQQLVCVLRSVVSTYLVHHGYCATANAFLRSTGQSCEEELASIQNRQSTNNAICCFDARNQIITSAKEVMFLPEFVYLSACVSAR